MIPSQKITLSPELCKVVLPGRGELGKKPKFQCLVCDKFFLRKDKVNYHVYSEHHDQFVKKGQYLPKILTTADDDKKEIMTTSASITQKNHTMRKKFIDKSKKMLTSKRTKTAALPKEEEDETKVRMTRQKSQSADEPAPIASPLAVEIPVNEESWKEVSISSDLVAEYDPAELRQRYPELSALNDTVTGLSKAIDRLLELRREDRQLKLANSPEGKSVLKRMKKLAKGREKKYTIFCYPTFLKLKRLRKTRPKYNLKVDDNKALVLSISKVYENPVFASPVPLGRLRERPKKSPETGQSDSVLAAPQVAVNKELSPTEPHKKRGRPRRQVEDEKPVTERVAVSTSCERLRQESASTTAAAAKPVVDTTAKTRSEVASTKTDRRLTTTTGRSRRAQVTPSVAVKSIEDGDKQQAEANVRPKRKSSKTGCSLEAAAAEGTDEGGETSQPSAQERPRRAGVLAELETGSDSPAVELPKKLFETEAPDTPERAKRSGTSQPQVEGGATEATVAQTTSVDADRRGRGRPKKTAATGAEKLPSMTDPGQVPSSVQSSVQSIGSITQDGRRGRGRQKKVDQTKRTEEKISAAPKTDVENTTGAAPTLLQERTKRTKVLPKDDEDHEKEVLIPAASNERAKRTRHKSGEKLSIEIRLSDSAEAAISTERRGRVGRQKRAATASDTHTSPDSAETLVKEARMSRRPKERQEVAESVSAPSGVASKRQRQTGESEETSQSPVKVTKLDKSPPPPVNPCTLKIKINPELASSVSPPPPSLLSPTKSTKSPEGKENSNKGIKLVLRPPTSSVVEVAAVVNEPEAIVPADVGEETTGNKYVVQSSDNPLKLKVKKKKKKKDKEKEKETIVGERNELKIPLKLTLKVPSAADSGEAASEQSHSHKKHKKKKHRERQGDEPGNAHHSFKLKIKSHQDLLQPSSSSSAIGIVGSSVSTSRSAQLIFTAKGVATGTSGAHLNDQQQPSTEIKPNRLQPKLPARTSTSSAAAAASYSSSFSHIPAAAASGGVDALSPYPPPPALTGAAAVAVAGVPAV
jgi:hypothetical protein